MQNTRDKRLMENKDEDLWLKRGVWIYFFLLIFEGALRKWLVPSLATPLLVVRDPVAIWLIYQVWRKGKLTNTFLLTAMVVITVISVITTLLFGHGNLPVAVFGARILLVHFPLMFVIGRIFKKEDVLEMGKMILMIAIPMALLIAVQFYSPQASFVNRGIGDNAEGGGFSGAMGYFRPPGTFSFTTGVTLFFSLCAPFVIYFWFNTGMNKILLIMATAAVLASIPLSISRTLFFSIGITLVFTVIGVLRNGKYAGKVIMAGVLITLSLLILIQLPFFQTAIEVFTSRFTNASDSEGGLQGTLGNRYIGLMTTALSSSFDQPFFGYGIGMGTNVGAMLISGRTTFLISEEEWGRVLGEMGTIMGLGVIFIRLGLSFKLFAAGFKKLADGDLLPWLLLSFGLLVIPQGQWAQPTNLGFSTLIGGLIIASFNTKKI